MTYEQTITKIGTCSGHTIDIVQATIKTVVHHFYNGKSSTGEIIVRGRSCEISDAAGAHIFKLYKELERK